MEINLSGVTRVYFLGIGGIGVSAIARMMLLQGKSVAGSDTALSEVTEELAKLGARIDHGQAADLIPPDTELVIYTIAISHYAPHILEAVKARGIPALSYPETLGLLSKDMFTIAVSGTHGKTTTTAMIAKVLMDAGKDPTVIVGSLLKEAKSNFIAGKSDILVVEACEYRRSFLNLHPSIAVITNIDNDHLDYYKDMADIESAFAAFAGQVKPEGFVVCNPAYSPVRRAVAGASVKVVDYTNCRQDVPMLAVPGMHNRDNASVALAVADVLGIPKETAQKSLSSFAGTWRRFEYKGMLRSGAKLYDDYGHHPSEIRATLEGAREVFQDKRLIVVFQPHLFSRTKLLLEEFAVSFSNADQVIFAPIYPAREVFDPTVSSDMLAERAQESGTNAIALPDFESIEKWLQENTRESDVVLTMGAGDVYKVGERLLVS